MAQPAGYRNPLSIPPLWQRASVEPPLEWSKRAAMMEMAVFAKDGIEVKVLLRTKTPVIEPSEPTYKVEITVETEAKKGTRDIRNQEKRVTWENNEIKSREKGVLCNNVPRDDADAKVRSYIFFCLGTEGQRQLRQTRPSLDIQTSNTKKIMRNLEDIREPTRIIAFEIQFNLSESNGKTRRWSSFTRIESNGHHGSVVQIKKTNGYLICSRLKRPMRKLQTKCWQKPDHRKTLTNMHSGERKVWNKVRR